GVDWSAYDTVLATPMTYQGSPQVLVAGVLKNWSGDRNRMGEVWAWYKRPAVSDPVFTPEPGATGVFDRLFIRLAPYEFADGRGTISALDPPSDTVRMTVTFQGRQV